MASDARIINMSDLQSLTDFLRLVDEVHQTQEPALLRQDNEVLLELRPAKAARKKGAKGKVFTTDDSLYQLVGSATSEEPTDAAQKHDYLAQAHPPL